MILIIHSYSWNWKDLTTSNPYVFSLNICCWEFLIRNKKQIQTKAKYTFKVQTISTHKTIGTSAYCIRVCIRYFMLVWLFKNYKESLEIYFFIFSRKYWVVRNNLKNYFYKNFTKHNFLVNFFISCSCYA